MRDHRFRSALAAVALLAFAVYAPSLRGGFVYDDLYQIRENDQLRDLRNVPGFFASDVWAAVGLPYSAYYRPLMYTSFALETALAGPVPWVFRATNVALHVAITVLLGALLLRLRAPRAAVIGASLLFAVHPMHAEVVAWPSARPELLVTLFSLLAAFVWAGAEPSKGPTRARFLAVGAVVMLALLSKETGVLAPVLIGLVALQRAEGSAGQRIASGVRAAAPFLALILVFLGLRGLAIQVAPTPPLVGEDPRLYPFRSAAEAAITVLAIAGRYLGAMLVPLDPSSFRVPRFENVRLGLAWLPLGVASIALAPRSRAACWLAFAFLAIALQSLGVPSAGYLSQRYAYLPSAGVCAALGLLFAAAWQAAASRAARILLSGTLALVALAWVVLLVPRSFEWADEASLWRAAIERDPEAPAPLANHGYMLLDAGRPADALARFERLEQVEPSGWAAPYGRGNALAAMGRLEEAVPFFEEAIRRAPLNPYLHQGLGFVQEDLGDHEKARAAYEKALELFPGSSIGEGILSVLELKQGHPAEALRRVDEALSQRGDHVGLRLNRVALLAELGRIEDAQREAEALLSNADAAAGAEAHLAILFDRHRNDPARALPHYRAALRLAPERPDAERIRRRIAAIERDAAPATTP